MALASPLSFVASLFFLPLVEPGSFSTSKDTKKFAAAVYEYQADCDGEWGEISLDFENGTAEIVRLADWDTIKTNRFANMAIAYLLNCENEKLPKETMVAFEV